MATWVGAGSYKAANRRPGWSNPAWRILHLKAGRSTKCRGGSGPTRSSLAIALTRTIRLSIAIHGETSLGPSRPQTRLYFLQCDERWLQSKRPIRTPQCVEKFRRSSQDSKQGHNNETGFLDNKTNSLEHWSWSSWFLYWRHGKR